MAGVHDILIEQGATFELPFVLRDKLTKVPLDLTGYTGAAYLKRKAADVTIVAEFKVTFPDAPNGSVLVTMDSSVTTTLQCGTDDKAIQSQYVYDVPLTSPDGKVLRALMGKASVSPGVTL